MGEPCPLCGREKLKDRVQRPPRQTNEEYNSDAYCLHPAHIYDLDLPPCERIGVERIESLHVQLALAVAVAEAARWACVAVLDVDTPTAELDIVRPQVAEQLLNALKAYDADRTARGLVSVGSSK